MPGGKAMAEIGKIGGKVRKTLGKAAKKGGKGAVAAAKLITHLQTSEGRARTAYAKAGTHEDHVDQTSSELDRTLAEIEQTLGKTGIRDKDYTKVKRQLALMEENCSRLIKGMTLWHQYRSQGDKELGVVRRIERRVEAINLDSEDFDGSL